MSHGHSLIRVSDISDALSLRALVLQENNKTFYIRTVMSKTSFMSMSTAKTQIRMCICAV